MSQWKRYATLPAKLLVWTAQGKLRERVRFAREYKLVADSGLFDRAYYEEQAGGLPDPLRHYLTLGVAEGLDPNRLFDSRWYLEQNPDVASQGLNPLVHFIASAPKESRNPHPLFDIRHYRANNLEAADSGLNPLLHYLTAGTGNPHVLFDGKRYLAQNPDIAEAGANPLVHYLRSGWKEKRSPHALFEDAYYLVKSPDVDLTGINPLVHFVTQGHRENRNPNALFDCAYYKRMYEDVAQAGTNPLIHYVLSGAEESRTPHPLFDPHHYSRVDPDSARPSVNALAHYLEWGVKRQTDPHPLFDVAYYREQFSARSIAGRNPVDHYLEEGTRMGADPCELFDTSFYLEKYSDVARSGENPLVHYVSRGAQAGYNPNPLFDSAYYLKQYPDVAFTGKNPLVHYIEAGAFEGRSPSPFFDSLFYLRKNPKLRALSINPLAHYLVRGGAEEGRDPNPFFSTSEYLRAHPEIRDRRINPLVHSLGLHTDQVRADAVVAPPPAAPPVHLQIRSLNIENLARASRSSDDKPTLICVTHVSPLAPRAGNEYRINRLLHWFKSAGYQVIPVLSPLMDEQFRDEQTRELAAEYGSAILCRRDGRTLCCLTQEDLARLTPGDGQRVPSFAERLSEDKPLDVRTLDRLQVDRIFCHDALVWVVEQLVAHRKGCIVLAEYVFMSRLLPVLNNDVLKVIDTHDVFSSKRGKVMTHGVSDGLDLTAEEERERLRRADLILAIQPEEQEELQRLSGADRRVLTVGVDFPLSPSDQIPSGRRILYVASDNVMNVRGLRDFLRFAWPSIVRAVPDAELLVAGNVCRSIRFYPDQVKLLGLVDDLGALYRECKLTINPAAAGTGLKIKTLEALSFLRPLVTWPNGVDGLDPALAALCCVARDWWEFHQSVAKILLDPRERWFGNQEQGVIEDSLSPTAVYAALERELSATFPNPEVALA